MADLKLGKVQCSNDRLTVKVELLELKVTKLTDIVTRLQSNIDRLLDLQLKFVKEVIAPKQSIRKNTKTKRSLT